MPLYVTSNMAADQVSQNLSTNQSAMQNSLEQLSSGYRINKAADDASGLAISQDLTSQINGFTQAQSNTQSAINVVQTADGALNEVSNILQRINTLAVEAANTSATDSTAQQAAQAEVTQSLASIDQIANSTTYGTSKLLSGTGASVNFTFQVGTDGSSNSQVTFTIATVSFSALGLSGLSVTASTALASIQAAIDTVSTARGTLGAYQNELQHISNNESVMTQNLQASNSSILDTNMASAMVSFTQQQILVQAGVSMLSQANSSQQAVLKLLG